jgi:hypothetical protein
MNGWLRASGAVLLAVVAAGAAAADLDLNGLWQESLAVEKSLRDAEVRLGDARALLRLTGEAVAAGVDAGLDEARQALKAAELARDTLLATAGIDRLAAEAEAALAEQDRLAEAEIAGVPRFEEMKRARAAPGPARHPEPAPGDRLLPERH